jgi:hypothetical protein
MRRRALLAALTAGVAGFAGCGSTTDGTTQTAVSSTATPSETDTRRPTTATADRTSTGKPTETATTRETETYAAEEPDRSLDVELGTTTADFADLETIDRTIGLVAGGIHTPEGGEYRIRTRTTATADHPLLRVASLYNGTGEEWTPPVVPLEPRVGRPPRPPTDPWDEPYRRASTGLVRAPTANHDLVDDPPTIYRPAGGLWRTDPESLPSLPGSVTLAPGETLFAEAALVGRSDAPYRTRPPGWYDLSPDSPAGIAVWRTGRPGPTEPSRFEGRTVPTVGDGTPTVWYHEADASTRAYLAPETERIELPTAFRAGFLNYARRPFECYDPRTYLYKRRGGRWFRVQVYPTAAVVGTDWTVDPGGSEWFFLGLHDRDRPADGWPPEVEVEGGAEFLNAGTYALVVSHPEPESPTEAERRSAALLDVDASATDVVPEDELTTVREGATVEVTRGSRDTPATVTVVRNDWASREAIAEQVMNQYRALRNTLPFFEPGVDRVVLRTERLIAQHTMRWLAPDESGSRRTATVRFRGEDYGVEATGSN